MAMFTSISNGPWNRRSTIGAAVNTFHARTYRPTHASVSGNSCRDERIVSYRYRTYEPSGECRQVVTVRLGGFETKRVFWPKEGI